VPLADGGSHSSTRRTAADASRWAANVRPSSLKHVASACKLLYTFKWVQGLEANRGNKVIDFCEIPGTDGELWELFARDFLQELGFYIVSPPDRGPDGKKDLIITEDLKGNLGNYKFRWLVSCKHFASSNRSVPESEEINIQERIDSYNADGFIGFYSTIPSSGLNTRLNSLREGGRIKDYKIFDGRLIENYLIRTGFSDIVMRYFPESYKSIKPLHLVLDEYIPLKCDSCEKDILELLYQETYSANLIFVQKDEFVNQKHIRHVHHVYCCCKGDCDERLTRIYERPQEDLITNWIDIGDLAIPIMYIRWIMTYTHNLREGTYIYNNRSFNRLQEILIALSQKVLRESTGQERERVNESLDFSIW
jgi:hypothetical protein